MSQVLLDYYKAIEDSSVRMLEAAKAEDWAEIMRFEGVCAVLIEQLRQCAQTEQLDEGARREKSRIMLRILNNDAQIRFLAEPWLQQIEGTCQQSQLLH
ncbi:MAG: hypothetical protein RIR09_1071 [Pseudomonadota bacterium]|jgi:flagellar protein FliT